MGLRQTAVIALMAALSAVPLVVLADNQCSQVPYVKWVDQSPTWESDYGRCTGAMEQGMVSGSNWCNAKTGLGTWPSPPTNKAKKCLKFGRTTIYRGPIYGSSPNHKGACNTILKGSDDAAMVAVSTKYLKTYQGGWASDTGACGQCMCVRLHGGDDKFNQGIQKENAKKHIGLTFKAKVGDRCSECEDDHIDLLQDRPMTFAPFNPSYGDNYNAPYVNAQDGLRGFSDPSAMRGTEQSPENVGIWTSDWQWVPCSWTHQQCANLMKDMGYDKVWTPGWVGGIDSFSMRPISQLRGTNNDRLFKEPWT